MSTISLIFIQIASSLFLIGRSLKFLSSSRRSAAYFTSVIVPLEGSATRFFFIKRLSLSVPIRLASCSNVDSWRRRWDLDLFHELGVSSINPTAYLFYVHVAHYICVLHITHSLVHVWSSIVYLLQVSMQYVDTKYWIENNK